MKRDYFSRLSLWARWYLPEKEAAEVLEDYREIVEGRSEEELRRDIGKPKDAVRCLVLPKTYHRWLMVFGMLAACELVPAMMSVNQFFLLPIPYFIRYSALAFAIGISLLWFRREGRREERFPKAVLFWMVLLLIGMLWAGFLAWAVLSENWTTIGFLFPSENPAEMNVSRGQYIQLSLIWSGVIMTAVSLFGIIKARLGDRRWCALYIFALTGSLVALSVYGILTRMSFSPGWQMIVASRIAFLTAAGLAGTAVSLC